MKTIFEQIANTNNWHFSYGRRDFHNLEETNKEFRFFLDPIEEVEKYSDLNMLEKTTYNGRFMLLMKSDLQDMYDSQIDNPTDEGRYKKYIERCREEIKKIPNVLICEGLTIEQWKIIEVINIFDENTDGVLVTFSISE